LFFLHNVGKTTTFFHDRHLDILELSAGLFGDVQVLPKASWEVGILDLEEIGIWTILVAENRFEFYLIF